MLKRMIALMLCWLLILPARAELTTTIVHATDLHYLSPAMTDYGKKFMSLIDSGDGKVVHYSPQIISAFVAEMLTLMPDAVILSGDLTFNGEPQSHCELAALLQPLEEAGIRVMALSGNHDSGSATWSYSEAGYTMIVGFPDGEFDDVYAALGYDDALARDAASQSYVARAADGVRVLLVDVNTNGTASTGVTSYVRDETLAWVEAQLQAASATGDTVIAVSHQPVLVHNSMFVDGKVITNAEALLSLYEQYGVTVNLSGHLHMQHIAHHGRLTEFVTGALSVAPIEYAVLTLRDGHPESYATRSVDVDSWAAAQGKTDANLLNFTAYAQAYFDGITARQMKTMLTGLGLPEETRQAMTDLAIRLNQEYFAGTRKPNPADRDIDLWVTYAPLNFITWYLKTIIQEETPMNTYIFQ